MKQRETKCKGCGKCCKEMFLPIELHKELNRDFVRWFNYHEKSKVVKIKGQYWLNIKLKCKKLKNNQCSIYKNRPQLCRAYNQRDCKFFKIY